MKVLGISVDDRHSMFDQKIYVSNIINCSNIEREISLMIFTFHIASSWVSLYIYLTCLIGLLISLHSSEGRHKTPWAAESRVAHDHNINSLKYASICDFMDLPKNLSLSTSNCPRAFCFHISYEINIFCAHFLWNLWQLQLKGKMLVTSIIYLIFISCGETFSCSQKIHIFTMDCSCNCHRSWMIRARSLFQLNFTSDFEWMEARDQLVLYSFVSWPLLLITHCADLSGVEENPISH